MPFQTASSLLGFSSTGAVVEDGTEIDCPLTKNPPPLDGEFSAVSMRLAHDNCAEVSMQLD